MEQLRPRNPVFRASGLTDVGVKRPSNEDAFKINEKYGLFIVADGVGGHAGGEIASNLVIKKVDDFISSSLNPSKSCRRRRRSRI